MKRFIDGCEMFPQKNEILTCVLVVTAALLVSIAKCAGCITKPL